MATNVVQHHEFAPGFDLFVKYVKDCSDEKSEERFEANKFRQAIDGFAPKLTLHLADEIPTLLLLDKYDEQKMNKVYDAFEKVIKDGDFKKVCIPTSSWNVSVRLVLTTHRTSYTPLSLDRMTKELREAKIGLLYRNS